MITKEAGIGLCPISYLSDQELSGAAYQAKNFAVELTGTLGMDAAQVTAGGVYTKDFDPTKMVKFSTYGVPMIIGEIRRYLRDNSAIRVSRSVRDVAYRALQCKEMLMLRLGREPSVEEIAQELDMPQEEISQAMDAVSAPVSLYDPVYSDGGDPLTVMDQVSDVKNTEAVWMEHIALRDAFRALGEREKQILSLRFYDGKTQMEVAGVLGISQAQVSRLEKGAIGAMRKNVSVS